MVRNEIKSIYVWGDLQKNIYLDSTGLDGGRIILIFNASLYGGILDVHSFNILVFFYVYDIFE